jgi:hypothetical protein
MGVAVAAGSGVTVIDDSESEGAEIGMSVATGPAIRWCWLVGKIFNATVFNPTTKTGSQSFPEERNGNAKPTRAVTMRVRKTKKFFDFIQLPSSRASSLDESDVGRGAIPHWKVCKFLSLYMHNYVTYHD